MFFMMRITYKFGKVRKPNLSPPGPASTRPGSLDVRLGPETKHALP
jgi:hypothetical protein